MTVSTFPNIEQVRALFPSFRNQRSAGAPIAYLDGPGGTQVPQSVIDAMGSYMATSNANAEGLFDASLSTDRLIARARAIAADFLGGDAEGIVFGQNMTSLNFALSRALGRSLSAGDEIVTTGLDHEANISPWLILARDQGLVVRQVGLTPELGIDLDELEKAVTNRTRVVAFTLASNAVGTVTPAKQITALAHERGALAWADAVAFAAHRRINAKDLGTDVILCSAYKFFGPHIGVAWLQPSLAQGLVPDRVRPGATTPPGHRFETGTQSHEGLAGLVAALQYIAALGDAEQASGPFDSAFAWITERETAMVERLLGGLAGIPNVTVAGVDDPDPARRVATVGLILNGVLPSVADAALARQGVNAWHGDFYATELIRWIGLDPIEGLLRLGVNHYTAEDELDHALAALGKVMRSRGRDVRGTARW